MRFAEQRGLVNFQICSIALTECPFSL